MLFSTQYGRVFKLMVHCLKFYILQIHRQKARDYVDIQYRISELKLCSSAISDPFFPTR